MNIIQFVNRFIKTQFGKMGTRVLGLMQFICLELSDR